MKTNLKSGLVSLALASMASVAFSQVPDEVEINNVIYGGSGCPQGTVATDITADRKAVTILFDEFYVDKNPGESLGRAKCNVALDLFIPPGWQFSVISVEYEGYYDLESGVMATQKSDYFFDIPGQTQNRVTFQSRYRGPAFGDYLVTDRLGMSSVVWSPCGVNRNLVIGADITVRGRSGFGFMSIDRIGTEIQTKHKYNFVWRRC